MRLVVLVSLAAVTTACAAGGGSKLTGTGSSSGGGGTGAGGNDGPGGLGGGFGQGGGGGGGPTVTEVFGHSSDTLYRLDPVTNSVTEVGRFNGCDSVIDIAVDKDSNIFATSYQGLHEVDKLTASCVLINGDGTYPNSLSFVPEGTLEPDEEVLVGYFQSDYVRINTITGAITTIGSLGGGYASSGDIVSVKGGGTYLTAYRANDCMDCLLEIDPVTGDLIKNWGTVGYGQVFGLAFWGGKAYGFSNAGDLFAINFGTSHVSTTPINIPSAPPNLQFWGAGSSTVVPLVPPE